MPAWYFKFKSFFNPQEALIRRAQELGFALDPNSDIWESSTNYGKGWVGVIVDEAQSLSSQFKHSMHAHLKHIEGGFEVIDMKGIYQFLAPAYKDIQRKYPQSQELYTVYKSYPSLQENTLDESRATIWVR